MHKIITISREFGSGGRELGRRLAEAMGIAYYDQEIVNALIQRTALAEEYIRFVEEQRPLPLFPITTARTFGISTGYAANMNLKFYSQESSVIREMAEKSSCVIVGRCGDYVLRELNPIRIFVYADMKYKIARCCQKGEDAKGVSEGELCRRILDMDRRRSRYYRFYTGQEWGAKENYDLCVNSGCLEVKRLATVFGTLFTW